MPISASFKRKKPRWILMAFILLSNCGGTPIDQALEPDFEVSFDIENPQLVAIGIIDEMSDTLTAIDFTQRIERLASLAPELMEDPEQAKRMKKEIVDYFLQNHIYLMEAEKKNISIDSSILVAEIEEFKSRYDTHEEYLRELENLDLSEEGFKKDTEQRLKRRQLIDDMRNSVSEPDSAEIQSYRESQQEARRVSHILFSFDRISDELTIQDLQQQAELVLDSLKDGEDFEELARRHSDDGSSRLGGDLGFFKRGQMVAPFEATAFDLDKNGSMSQKLTRTRFGYHIIKLVSTRVDPLQDWNESKTGLVNQIRQSVQSEQLSELRSRATLRLNSAHISEEEYH